MIIKKDGTVYTLRGPNPIMKDQELWTDFVGHNLEWQAEATEEGPPPFVPPTPEPSFIQELQQTAPKEPEIIPEPKPEVKKEKTVFELTNLLHYPMNLSKKVKTEYIYCLPASTPTTYGNPFAFDGVLIDTNDIFLNFWTNINLVTEKSIVYPRSPRIEGMHASDRALPVEKRWWKIHTLEPKSGGWLCRCVVSDFQPSFGRNDSGR